tara:strand:- start:611 stop:814 length:204 start_codon:yes stop_codon:yes gene_type:complete
MSYYKQHKIKAIKVLESVCKHVKKCNIDYEMIDFERALDEVKLHYFNYLKMQQNENYKPKIEHKSYK